MKRSPIFQIAKEEREASGGMRRENAPSRRKSFRLDDTAASSNGRKRGDDIVRCFQEISLHLVVKGNKEGVPYVRCTLRRFLLRICSAMYRATSWFCLTRRPDFWHFWSSDDDLTKIEEQKGPGLISLSTTIDAYSRDTRGWSASEFRSVCSWAPWVLPPAWKFNSYDE